MCKEIILTKGLIAIVDDEDYEKINFYKWRATQCNGKWYSRTYLKYGDRSKRGTRRPYREIYMHQFILNNLKKFEIDHINGNCLDNRRYNLRVCSHKENMCNLKSRIRCSSNFKGVSWSKLHKKWYTYINRNSKRHFLGLFDSEINAAIAYNNAAIKYHGEFARLNIIKKLG